MVGKANFSKDLQIDLIFSFKEPPGAYRGSYALFCLRPALHPPSGFDVRPHVLQIMYYHVRSILKFCTFSPLFYCTGKNLKFSSTDPGFLSRILDPNYFLSRISDPRFRI